MRHTCMGKIQQVARQQNKASGKGWARESLTVRIGWTSVSTSCFIRSWNSFP
jgi:hypothetical protein